MSDMKIEKTTVFSSMPSPIDIPPPTAEDTLTADLSFVFNLLSSVHGAEESAVRTAAIAVKIWAESQLKLRIKPVFIQSDESTPKP